MTGHQGNAPSRLSERSIGWSNALSRRFGNVAGSRAYDLVVPSGYDDRGPRPLVVMLHGSSQTARDFAIGTGMNQLADEQGFLVAYPDQPRAANLAKSWNWFRYGDQERDMGEPSILAGITRQVMDECDVDPARVYIAGLSAGGAAAAIMAQAYPDLYAAVGIHSGLASGSAGSMSAAFSTMRRGALLTPRRATHPVPTIVFHGDRDETVSSVNGDQAMAQAQPVGEMTLVSVEGRSEGGMDYTRTLRTEPGGAWASEHWMLHGGGHAWSGGHPAGSHTAPAGPDASREMLRFFMAHPKERGSSGH